MSLFSCSKVSYLTEQGIGQLKLQWNGKDYKKVLEDPQLDPIVKSKIKLIQKYKKFFYHYFEKKSTDIYSRVTFLDTPAVTYLVIASPYQKIEPIKHSFPFMGSFPYLGFFKKKSAEEYQQELEKEEYFTFLRPVYAYSTLGYFEDRILSSFFHFNEVELADLIFHELFHTIFFLKGEVDLNESMAEFFSKKMVEIYFKWDDSKKQTELERLNQEREMNLTMAELIRGYSKELEKDQPLSKAIAQTRLDHFLEKIFYPKLKEFCEQKKISLCYPLKVKWNHASFSAFMTYEKNSNKIEQVFVKRGSPGLKDFLTSIEKNYQEYQDQRIKIKFEEYLLNE